MSRPQIPLILRRLAFHAALLLGAVALPSTAGAQSDGRPSVSGPSAPREAPPEEAVYRLLRQQLEALMAAQDAARAERGAYARRFGRGAQGLAFKPGPGVTVRLDFASDGGWAATARHAALATKSCVVWVGMVRPDRRPTTAFDQNAGYDAEIVCDLVP